jgi:hypothetical protein
MRVFYKENYGSADTTKVLHVSLLKVICVEPEFLEPPHDLARVHRGYAITLDLHNFAEAPLRKRYFEDKKTPEEIAKIYGVSVETIQPYIAKLLNGEKFDGFTKEYKLSIYTNNLVGKPTQLFYHTDFLSTDYKYTEDYGHEISEDLKKVASEEKGILLQTVWDIAILSCSFDIGTTAEELANSVSWELNRSGDLLTKILSVKFSTHFFTKCAILSDVLTNHSDDESLAEFIEYNDIGLPLAQRVNLAETMSEFELEDFDEFDYIEETWEQLCETLGVDKDGDYTSLADMREIKSTDREGQ